MKKPPRREDGRFQIMSRWVVWWDMRKSLAYRLVFDPEDFNLTVEDVGVIPGPPGNVSSSKLVARRGVWMSPAEIRMVIKLLPAAQEYMDGDLYREAKQRIEEMKAISTVDLLGALG